MSSNLLSLPCVAVATDPLRCDQLELSGVLPVLVVCVVCGSARGHRRAVQCCAVQCGCMSPARGQSASQSDGSLHAASPCPSGAAWQLVQQQFVHPSIWFTPSLSVPHFLPDHRPGWWSERQMASAESSRHASRRHGPSASGQCSGALDRHESSAAPTAAACCSAHKRRRCNEHAPQLTAKRTLIPLHHEQPSLRPPHSRTQPVALASTPPASNLWRGCINRWRMAVPPLPSLRW